jgi:cytoskeleton protein RodZ
LESHGIGERLREKRLALGLSFDDLGRQTRIQPRFLEAIEADDLSVFSGIIFIRNFVRQYALALELDPEPLLEGLPRLDQSTVALPEPPAHPRGRRYRPALSPSWTSAAWALAAALAVSGAYLYNNQGWRITLERKSPAEQEPPGHAASAALVPAALVPANPAPAPPNPDNPVQVVITASERVWLSVRTDGNSGYTYIGTLNPNETRAISALEQVKIVTGNAGGISVSLNGKTLDPFGRHGQLRTLRLTAEGPELLSKDQSASASAPDPI